jgi:DNA-binding CsgD family transcriptional regulator
MIRLTDILLEDDTYSDEAMAIRLVNRSFGSSWKIIKKEISPVDPTVTFYLLTEDGEFYTGGNGRLIANYKGTWMFKHMGKWEPFPPMSNIIPVKKEKIPLSPELVATRKKRKEERELLKKKQENEFWRNFYQKNPNIKQDFEDLSSGTPELDYYMNLTGLSEREHRILCLRNKGYSLADIGTMFRLNRSRVDVIYKNTLNKIKSVIKTGENPF